ncbi:MAG: TonB-dependent receptor [Prevotella sp.]|nr:TonB-dependent receptor [Prevotella sp.]
MKKVILLTLLMLTAITATAQDRAISGYLQDRDTKEGVPFVTVQLLKSDSTFVTGAISDDDGNFRVEAPENGKYILKISSVGYKTLTRNVSVANDTDVSLGKLEMGADAIMLKGTTVTGQAAKVVVKEDTFQYNASAYRVPEGSTVEALVKKLPGAEVGDDGTIKINGKEVKKILVDGKEFMTGDTKTALKNLPTSIVERVKAYDQQSDLSRVTGIDDGEEQTVLDFGIKKGMNKGLFSNIDLGIGTKGRYAEKLMGAWFNSKWRVMLMGNANNVNDVGFGGGPRGGFGQARQGLNATKMAGLNFNYDGGTTLKMDGSLRWNHSDGDLNTRSSSENFVSTAGSFSNSLSQNYTRSDSWDFRYRLEWQPDSMTNIMFRPNAQISKSDGRMTSTSATYNEDPYEYVENPLEQEAIDKMQELGLMVNTQKNASISYGENKNVGSMLQLNRKLSQNGRNVTLRGDVAYKDAESTSLSVQNVHLYQIMNYLQTGDSTYQTNRYNLMPTRSWSYSVQATYSEPIAKQTYLQFSYKYGYSFSKSDRSTYDFSNLGEDYFGGVSPAYRSWNSYLSLLPYPLEDYLDTDLSRYSEYRTYTHEAQVMLRWIREKYRLNVGVMVQPQRSRYMQDYLGVHTDTVRNVVNWSPTLDFRYRFSKQSNLRINYRGTTTQPSMSDLLSIVDDSDPLNIKVGNPGLKPSFTNRLRLFYNTYLQSHQRSIMTFLNYSNTRNSISNKVTYDQETGGRTTQPENINGNWDMNAAFMFNTSIDSAGVWNVNTFTTAGYNHYVGYLSLQRNADSQKNVTRSTTLGERLSASYRNAWIEIELDGSLNYTHSRNQLQSSSDLDTWQFAYGTNINLTLPWGTMVSTDLHENSRRGYNDASLNTNELVWNAQVSHSLLKGNALTLSVQFYDILHNQSNLSRVINAMQRTDTEYNSINSYIMFRASYRLNLFGGKEARQQRGDGPGFDREGPGMGPRPEGERRGNGGFGGGNRPPRGGGFGGPMMLD